MKAHFSNPPPLCDSPSGCCSFTGPWTVTRSSLRMLCRVAAFCRPLQPVLLLVSFPRSRSPAVGVPGLFWMWQDVPFARQRRPVVGVLRMCWLLLGSFDCRCPRASVHRPSIACLAVFLCSPGALFLHALSRPSTICSFPPHGWCAPDGLPLLLRKQPIWAAGDTPHLMPVEQGLPWHPVATGLAGQAIPCGGVFAQRGHSAGTAPIITVIIQVTTLKTTPPAESCTIQNSKIQTSDACHGSQGPKFCPL